MTEEEQSRSGLCPRGRMWAEGMPTMAVPGKDWRFEGAVGVDCCAPEPRCIWLAVLRGVPGGSPCGPPQGYGSGRERQRYPHQLRVSAALPLLSQKSR